MRPQREASGEHTTARENDAPRPARPEGDGDQATARDAEGSPPERDRERPSLARDAYRPSPERTVRRAFLVLMVAATVLLGVIVAPLAAALACAAALAGVLWPLQQKLAHVVRGRRGIASGVLVLGVVLALVGPIVGLSAVAVKEASEGVQYVAKTVRSEGMTGLMRRLPPPLRGVAEELIERVPRPPGENLDDTVERQFSAQGGKAAQAVGVVFAATGSFLFQATMMLIAFFFLLVHGRACVDWLDEVSPLKKGQTRELLSEFKRVSYSVIVSTLITAGVQASAALIGYYIARVPHPLFFGAITFFAAFIPAFGAGGVCLTLAVLLWLTGHPHMALFLAIWGLTVVALVDNVVKPFLIKRGMELHGAIVFFSLVGGLLALGAIGLLIGPLIVSVFLAVLRIWHRDFGPNGGERATAIPPGTL